MRPLRFVAIAAIFLNLAGCQFSEEVEQPMAKRIPKKLVKHGHLRTDDYYWLHERENPEVLAHLEAESQYTASMMAHTEGLQEKLFHEFKTRIKQSDISVPYKKESHYYYRRTEEGRQYPIYCRKKGSLEAAEQVMVDVNRVAEGHGFCSVRRPEVSPREDIMAYAVDTVGRRFYILRFKNLSTGKMLNDVLPDVTGGLAWANDNRTLFYAKQDPQTLRSHRIYRHRLGDDPAADELVYEETDETFSSSVFKTKSKKYILIASVQTLATEYRTLDAGQPNGTFQVFQPRQRDHEYHVDHYRGDFYIRTNDKAKNFRLMKTSIKRTGREHWRDLIPHRDDVFLDDFEIFNDQLVVVERKEGLLQMRVMPWSGGGGALLGLR